jgi:putative hydrolase of the HAD superfamily
VTAPRAILFDLGDTLLCQESFHPEAWADALSALAGRPEGFSGPQVRELVRGLVWEFRGPSKGGPVEVRMEACLRHLHDRLGVTLELGPAEVELAFWRATSRMAPAPGIGPVLDDLASRGLALGVVSNSMFGAEVLRWELARHGLAAPFRFVMSSADYGLRKPHPSLFQTALARLGLPAEEVWFVGDSYANDVLGASGVGMPAVWYNPPGRPPPEAVRAPDAEVRSWGEFRALAADQGGGSGGQ